MNLQATTREYVFYVGEPIGNISLWKRIVDYEETDHQYEQPIYANTRGQDTWYSYRSDEFENTEPVEPTEAFWDALSQISDADRDRIDVEDCEWYEREVVHSLIQMMNQGNVNDSMGELLTYVEEKNE